MRMSKHLAVEALKRPSCHVERSGTFRVFPSSAALGIRSDISLPRLRDQNGTGAERFNGSTFQRLYERMSFGAKEWLWGLLLIPLLIALFVHSERRGLKRLQLFVSPRLLPQSQEP